MPTNAKTIDEYNEMLGEAIEARLVPLFQVQVLKLQEILCYDGEAIEPDGNASDLLVQIQILELFAECEEFLGYADEDKLLVIARVIKGSRKYQEARSLAEKLIAKVGS
ncbi:hypothetical protein VPHD249_0189 [Vibrio phage D249]|nr:hypothetical protein SIPHO041v1_p0168 [Vibrio phage 234P1]QZI88280.1 hypothetical protein SIPHO082v1_p0003 [Vibrio phage 294E48.1]QZI88619.1 hypothetical protein SIPHO037v1_p0178 [Vibrio phage 70E35.2]QZI88804.1 hypothetical protein SIPHO039v1_p0175 [Vibrio phage 70E35.5a]QZI88987.1 hypothetical protein SIPHO040v1_p0174 [Vibrio phage 70E35.6]QZI89034.1 hypothetical protein SIPHO042v1_p0037 [Vibrio phage 70E37.1]QZI89252.1 hypothetical protein SIPHO038v1_p0074 [Vibrio phage 70E37.6]